MNEKPLNPEAKLLTLTEVVMDLIQNNLINKPEPSKEIALQKNLDRLCKAFPGSKISISRHLESKGKSYDDPFAQIERLSELLGQGELVFTDHSRKTIKNANQA